MSDPRFAQRSGYSTCPTHRKRPAVLRPLRSSSMGRRWACSRCRSGPGCRRKRGRGRPFHNCAKCANRCRVIWIWNGNAPKSLCYSAVFAAPGISTVCSAEDCISETNNSSVISIGKGNCGEDKYSRRRLRDPAVSAVCCSRIMPSPVSSDPPTATPWFASVKETPLRSAVYRLFVLSNCFRHSSFW